MMSGFVFVRRESTSIFHCLPNSMANTVISVDSDFEIGQVVYFFNVVTPKSDLEAKM